MKRSESIIEYIRQHAGEFDAYPNEMLQIELWCYQELKALEGFKTQNKVWSEIISHGPAQSETNYKTCPVKDIEQEYAKQHHSNHSPQEQELEEQEEKQAGDELPELPTGQAGDKLPRYKQIRNRYICSLLYKLTDKQKLAFLLHISGFNIRNSAKIMNIKKSACHKHLQSALKKLNKTT